MGNVLGINYSPGMCAILGDRGINKHYNQGFENLIEGIDGHVNYKANSLDVIGRFAHDFMSKETKVISGDHVVVHPLFDTVDKNRPKFDVGRGEKLGAVVLDQHVDAYKYGKGIQGNNVYRRLIESGIVDNVVVLGVRPSEYALFTGRKEDRKGLPFYNKVTAQVFHREFDGMHGRINAVPLALAGNMADAVEIGLKELTKRGVAHIGVDIDADVFDSSEMTGVGYSPNALKKFWLPERIFIENQLNEKGMTVGDIAGQMKATNEVLRGYSGNVNVIFKHLTEIDPVNEIPVTGTTERLVRAFSESL